MQLESKWGDVDICGAGSHFNIDAKLNGAYIVMGLLYGEGDPLRTLEISTRCGQDSDCNPSNAMAVLGVINGFSGLPAEMQDGIKAIADSTFIHTSYSFNTAVEATYRYALELNSRSGGKSGGNRILIKKEEPSAPELEISFPDLVFDRKISVFDKKEWKFKGKWEIHGASSGGDVNQPGQAMFSENSGDELSIDFSGTGISLEGNWYRDGGRADVYLDGKLHRTIDTYYDYAGQQHTESIWHALNLEPGDHSVRLVVKGENRPESNGSRIYITSAVIFKTAPKKNEAFKF